MRNIILDGVGGQRWHQLLSVENTDHPALQACTPLVTPCVFAYSSSHCGGESKAQKVKIRVVSQERFSVVSHAILTL